ncbi:MAG: hypothetical protein A3C93_03165 [Candidatus Lloydbacteria bacterium RIFCSPHIGHO2_02_FULL_54_17]|uniref:Uncharacterized protein n=1 Tax=Candidatus Lloydbacteria bacterium RIFCSPHIGHO2_02_FULL_54_17 TaxID=1798664 RepID=A0A1G2DEK9_9BACT|nr:MAG: hypothetical protein A2762_04185 [Candidatus Lloydbacteria bacterium RIFCSPHIGHO2_01_FULL_54_11]OGZ12077.1 MAG: hypothetical protein A3C93_03165 [Candidatus Lloydbacteria bacterium RIFCSPHIGHO2_02_FULL_54_17]OGZ13390.1 MAG: hypothetical protein A2948_01380 [Candidatus Lloydbacteria bacterium RIFCSPLOWO2_01_FULL_54_18]OGZ15753.1 MAG: hypothetical protein A3H76_06465 [Candidatus Lloydbacteria bacterium RIFCSPLOWO2_02_FULL_54_12]
MHTGVFKFLALIFFLFSPFASHAQDRSGAVASTETACVSAGQTAAITYAIREFQGRVQDGVARTVAWNDLMCMDQEWMMNVVLTFADAYSAKAWYGVFHIHFLPNGTFKSAASINDVPWTPMADPDDW